MYLDYNKEKKSNFEFYSIILYLISYMSSGSIPLTTVGHFPQHLNEGLRPFLPVSTGL